MLFIALSPSNPKGMTEVFLCPWKEHKHTIQMQAQSKRNSRLQVLRGTGFKNIYTDCSWEIYCRWFSAEANMGMSGKAPQGTGFWDKWDSIAIRQRQWPLGHLTGGTQSLNGEMDIRKAEWLQAGTCKISQSQRGDSLDGYFPFLHMENAHRI